MRDAASAEFLELQAAVAGRYSLDRELGRGGMGIVFLARDVGLDRPVAIKLLRPELSADLELREQFLREARTAAKLSHPNIVPIHAVEEVDGLVFFVMTFIEGETLTERIATGGPLPTKDGVRLLREVAWALVHAHGQDLVHRDIKGDNILLERESGRALVTDFGIAQASGTAEAAGDVRVVGTPEFMSPEQARGEPVDARSDLYSLGVVGFLALSGRYPFDGGSSVEHLAHHITTVPPPLVTAAPGVPKGLTQLIDRCLAKSPAARCQTANELAEALGAVLETRAGLPVPVRVYVEETKRREQVSAGVVVLTLFLAPVGVGLVLLSPLALIPLTGLVSLPTVSNLLRLRRLIGAGYGQEDLAQGFGQDLTARHEELTFLHGPNHAKTTRRLRVLSLAGLSSAGIFVFGLAAGVGGLVAEPYLLLGSVTSFAAGVLAGTVAERRSDRRARRRWQFWKGRAAKWLFGLAGVRLDKPKPSPALTHRPTELALGGAVDSLYEALGPGARDALPDLPAVVRGLEADAQRMRKQVDELTTALQGIAPGARSVDEERLRDRLEGLRAEAQRRLREAVAALDTLRVDLLRLHAGSANLERVTTNLGNAREVAADIQRLLEGQAELEAFLEGDD